MPFSHAVEKQSFLKEELPFFQIQLFQMLIGYKNER